MANKNQVLGVQRIFALIALSLWVIAITTFVLTSVVTSILGLYFLAALACFVLLVGLLFAVHSFLKPLAVQVPIISDDLLTTPNRNFLPDKKPLRILLLGDHKVGKSTFMKTAAGRTNLQSMFSSNETLNVNIQHVKKKGTIIPPLITSEFSEGYSPLKELILTNFHCILMFYDVTNKASFEKVKDNFKKIKGNPLIILVSCKIDLKNDRQVDQVEVENWAVEKGILFREIDAKDPEQVKDILLQLVLTCNKSSSCIRSPIKTPSVVLTSSSGSDPLLSSEIVFGTPSELAPRALDFTTSPYSSPDAEKTIKDAQALWGSPSPLSVIN